MVNGSDGTLRPLPAVDLGSFPQSFLRANLSAAMLEVTHGTHHRFLPVEEAAQSRACDIPVCWFELAENPTLDQIVSLLGHSSNKTTKGYVH